MNVKPLLFDDLEAGDKFALVSYPSVNGTKISTCHFVDHAGVVRLIASTSAFVERTGEPDRVACSALLEELTKAMVPLISFRDRHLEIEGFAYDETDDPVLLQAAEALDRAFDELDSVTRILEDPNDYVET